MPCYKSSQLVLNIQNVINPSFDYKIILISANIRTNSITSLIIRESPSINKPHPLPITP